MMEALSSNRMIEIYHELRKLGCCKRCGLRYIGVRDSAAYEDCDDIVAAKIAGLRIVFETSSRSDDEPPTTKHQKKNSCVLCLGLLDHLIGDDVIDDICKNVIAEQYDSPVIACAVSLPIAMQLRAHAMTIHLQKKVENFIHRQVVPIKEAWKWACLKKVAIGVGKEASSGAVCDFLVQIGVSYNSDKMECQHLIEIHEDQFDKRMRNTRKFHGQLFTRQGVEGLLENTDEVKFQQFYSCPPIPPDEPASYSKVTCSHNSIFIAGRYNKFSRELSQTPWLVDGQRRIEASVQELICLPLEEAIKCKPSKFLASGREDVDVRTLGRGRPFAVELPDPHQILLSQEQLNVLQAGINYHSKGQVSVRDLQFIPKEGLVELKSGEETKTKVYEALCVSLDGCISIEKLESLNSIRNLVLNQKTPVRVLHRRSLATRLRSVLNMSAKKVDDKHFKISLEAQAGTYVKEFVHGDFGRTYPNLGSLLGVSVDILALDVQEVQLDWPKPLTSM